MGKQLTAHYYRCDAPFRVLTVELNGATPTQVCHALNRQRFIGSAAWGRITKAAISRYREYVSVTKAYYNRDTGDVQDFRTGEVIR